MADLQDAWNRLISAENESMGSFGPEGSGRFWDPTNSEPLASSSAVPITLVTT